MPRDNTNKNWRKASPRKNTKKRNNSKLAEKNKKTVKGKKGKINPDCTILQTIPLLPFCIAFDIQSSCQKLKNPLSICDRATIMIPLQVVCGNPCTGPVIKLSKSMNDIEKNSNVGISTFSFGARPIT